ncbi:hypothetical protein GCM10022631_04810 [Deinococcus rubellus]|uniref:Helix-turn-helix domain-containing protein n=1 Tax=Deinococcus rubellus TaxID=1889240 RepID=A0ABY5YGW7_9DEIO|nr:helix-turn-helix transcriptional regulator [Deinococcus rubellus]UWX64166.1 helix-turn-helix domain-containing protein [Deinococcus rubellus]
MPENTKIEHVGEAIKARRTVLGLTQTELCKRLGWNQKSISTISQIENGSNTNLTLESLRRFAQALDFSVSDLVHGLSTDLQVQEAAPTAVRPDPETQASA